MGIGAQKEWTEVMTKRQKRKAKKVSFAPSVASPEKKVTVFDPLPVQPQLLSFGQFTIRVPSNHTESSAGLSFGSVTRLSSAYSSGDFLNPGSACKSSGGGEMDYFFNSGSACKNIIDGEIAGSTG